MIKKKSMKYIWKIVSAMGSREHASDKRNFHFLCTLCTCPVPYYMNPYTKSTQFVEYTHTEKYKYLGYTAVPT